MNPESRVTVRTYATEVAADAAGACLEANGIRCLLSADDCGGMFSAMDNFSGIKVIVAADDAESARQILSREGVPAPESSDEELPNKPASV